MGRARFGRKSLERDLRRISQKHMSKIVVIAVAVILAACIVAKVRHRGAQPAAISTFEPNQMKDFKKPETAELKKKLSSKQFAVNQHAGTDPAFHYQH